MLTLKVESDGTPSDLQQIVSLAFNTGMTVVAELPDGTTATATPTQATEVPVEVDEPHPVLEKEVPAEPPQPEEVVIENTATSEVTESSP